MQKKFIGRKFKAIHRSRELVIQFLYSLDVCPEQDFDSSLEMFLNLDDVAKNDAPDVKKRCRDLASQVWNRKNEIDGVLLRVVTGWRPERMVSVDRAILRLLVFEGFLGKTLPTRSAIAEANKLANDFGTKDSARFINGVLSKMEKFFEAQEDEKLNG
ncbi:MAG: transcription antitermination factor NusB [Synergistaceae bacterium]|nr:transcription antitermination factor NusB [Synergistaceae bacterium]